MLDKEKIFALIRQNTRVKKFIIAYSGGVDSHVLLHLMSEFPGVSLKVVHINHGLQAVADNWQRHCGNICESLSVDLVSEKVEINNVGKGIESAAREARYHILEKYVDSNTCLMTAHNQDDQAETFLLRLMRGAGVKGLAAMSIIRKFGEGMQLRPLLFTSRQDIESYAVTHDLDWIEDTSNKDIRFDRNYLRQKVLPCLEKRWPQAKQSVRRAAEHMQASTSLLMEYAAEDFERVISQFKDDIIPQLDRGIQPGITLNCKKLFEYSPSRIFNVLRYWITQLNLTMPSQKQLEHVLIDCINGRDTAQACVHCGEYTFYRYRGELHLVLPENEITFSLSNIDIPNAFHRDKFEVCFREGGERIKLAGRQHHSLLKKLFQDWGVPPWQRDKVPLVYYDDELVAVVGYAVAEHFNFIKIKHN